MSANEKTQTQIEYEKFILVTKRILKENISTNELKLKEYRTQIINANNEFVSFIRRNYRKVDRSGQAIFDDKLEEVRDKFVRCLQNLECRYRLPEDLQAEIKEGEIGEVKGLKRTEIGSTASTSTTSGISITANPPSSEDESDGEAENRAKEQVERAEKELEEREAKRCEEEQRRIRLAEKEKERQELEAQAEADRQEAERRERERRQQEEHLDRKRRENDDTMTEALKAQKELLDIVNGQIRRPYDGDPMGLQTFVTAIDIATDFATTDALKRKLVTYVKGKLDGRAREIVTDDIETIQELIDTLKEKIKPETSKIIEARIATLRYSYGKQEEFATKTEELADALRRTLIIEGMTPAKANEITVDRTIQLCRKSTQSDIVKAVLCATKFDTAKDVIAKLITSNDECVKERQILRNQKGNNPNQQVRGKYGRGRGYNNYNNRGRNYQNNFQTYRKNNYNGNYNYNGGGYRGNGGSRGRGGRGNFGNRVGYKNGYQNYQNTQSQSNGNWRMNRNQNVRLAQSENSTGPQAIMGGPHIQQMN